MPELSVAALCIGFLWCIFLCVIGLLAVEPFDDMPPIELSGMLLSDTPPLGMPLPDIAPLDVAPLLAGGDIG